MNCQLRRWTVEDAESLAKIISNKKLQDNLRDGIPFPYTVQDGRDFISEILSSDKNNTFAFAITVDGKLAGSIGAFRRENIHFRTAELGYYLAEEYLPTKVST